MAVHPRGAPPRGLEAHLTGGERHLADWSDAVNADDWTAAVKDQWERVEAARDQVLKVVPGTIGFEDGMAASRRLRTDSHLLVTAIRQLLHTQEAYLKATGDERLTEARREFDAAVPHAKDFRDWLEHMDEYVVGRGKLQRAGEVSHDPAYATVTQFPTGKVWLHFDGRELVLEEAVAAALKLGAVASEVRNDAFNEGLGVGLLDGSPKTEGRTGP